ncbi:unnamed protein product [Neospora caninum Liverpool]|uniref:AP2 domain transcription factor AP2XI-2 n=1 Tax=Neospora caninum (strain Liverpool) TaxID=572307 RepID=F0VMX1_NEOCL|nr:uncharacterized protein NCLIV_054920 [Neospora caninum Liverpool]CBZ55067.1 unnamed protein product [Neospora caninum Liverpool]CEL69791.1 TPA: AP2 domain transcription factor AP2XI-2 [Neospora caninum Liverpool]|eukprot:XP_003885095.1 uncharacterized protein NCLIV_054920 [Neospora caninum Liverpool]
MSPTVESEAGGKAPRPGGGFALNLRSRRVSVNATEAVSPSSLLAETTASRGTSGCATPGKAPQLGVGESRSPVQSKGGREEKDKKNRLLSRRLATSSGNFTIRRTSSSTSASSTSDGNVLVPAAGPVNEPGPQTTEVPATSSFLTSFPSVAGAEGGDGARQKSAGVEAPGARVLEETRAQTAVQSRTDGTEAKGLERKEKRPAAPGSLSGMREEKRKKTQGQGTEKSQAESFSRSNTMSSNAPSKPCLAASDEEKSLSRTGSALSSFSVHEENQARRGSDGEGKVCAPRLESTPAKIVDSGPLDPDGAQRPVVGVSDPAPCSGAFAALPHESGDQEVSENRSAPTGESERPERGTHVAIPPSPAVAPSFRRRSLSLDMHESRSEGPSVCTPSESAWPHGRKPRDPARVPVSACAGSASPFSPPDVALFLDCLFVGEQAARRAHARLDAVMRDVETAYSAVARAGACFASLLGIPQLSAFAASDLAASVARGRSRGSGGYRGRGDLGGDEGPWPVRGDQEWGGGRWGRVRPCSRAEFGLPQEEGLEAAASRGREVGPEDRLLPPFLASSRPCHSPCWTESVSRGEAGTAEPGLLLLETEDRAPRLAADRGSRETDSTSLLFELAEFLWNKGALSSRPNGDGDSEKRPRSSAEAVELLRAFSRDKTRVSADLGSSFDLASPRKAHCGRHPKGLGEASSGAVSPHRETGPFAFPPSGALGLWPSEQGASTPDGCGRLAGCEERKRAGATPQRAESGECGEADVLARSEKGDAACLFDCEGEELRRKKSGSTTSSQSGGASRGARWREQSSSSGDRTAGAKRGDRGEKEGPKSAKGGAEEGGSAPREKTSREEPGSGEDLSTTEVGIASEGISKLESANLDQKDHATGGEAEDAMRLPYSSKEVSRATSKSGRGGDADGSGSGTGASAQSGVLTRGRAAACRQKPKAGDKGNVEEGRSRQGTGRGVGGGEGENKVGDSEQSLAIGIEEFLHAFKTRHADSATPNDRDSAGASHPQKRAKLAGVNGSRSFKAEGEESVEGSKEGKEPANGAFSPCGNLPFSDRPLGAAEIREKQEVESDADEPERRFSVDPRSSSTPHWLFGGSSGGSPPRPRGRLPFWDGTPGSEGRADLDWKMETGASLTSEEKALVARFGHLFSPSGGSASRGALPRGDSLASLWGEDAESDGLACHSGRPCQSGRRLPLWIGDGLSASSEARDSRGAGGGAALPSWTPPSEKGRGGGGLSGPRKQDLIRGESGAPGSLGSSRRNDPDGKDDLPTLSSAYGLSGACCPREPACAKMGASKNGSLIDCASSRSSDFFNAAQFRSTDETLGCVPFLRGNSETSRLFFRGEGAAGERESRWSLSAGGGASTFASTQFGLDKPSESLASRSPAFSSQWAALASTRGARLPSASGRSLHNAFSPYDTLCGARNGTGSVGRSGCSPEDLDDAFSQETSFLPRSGTAPLSCSGLALDAAGHSAANAFHKDAFLSAGFGDLGSEKGSTRNFSGGLDDAEHLFSAARGGAGACGVRRPSSRDSEEGSSSDGDLPEAAKTTWPGAVGNGPALAPRLHCVVPVGASRKPRSPGESGETRESRDGRGYVSDVPGVSYRSTPHSGWRFRWKDAETGKEYSRCFSVNKFGFERAKRKAERVAREMRQGRSIIISNHTRTKVYLAETNGSPSGDAASVEGSGAFNGRVSQALPSFLLNAPGGSGGPPSVSSVAVSSAGGPAAHASSLLASLCEPEKTASKAAPSAGDATLGAPGVECGSRVFFASGGAKADFGQHDADGGCSPRFDGSSPFFLSLQTPCGGSTSEASGSGAASSFLFASAREYARGESKSGEPLAGSERQPQSSAFASPPFSPGALFQTASLAGGKTGAGAEGGDSEKEESLSSSVRGVIFEHSRGSWRGLVVDKDTGRQQVRRFSARKYGHMEARVRAERFCLEAQRFRETRGSNAASGEIAGGGVSPLKHDLCGPLGDEPPVSPLPGPRGGGGDSPGSGERRAGASTSFGATSAHGQPASVAGGGPGDGPFPVSGGKRRSGREREASEASKLLDAAGAGLRGDSAERESAGNENGAAPPVKEGRGDGEEDAVSPQPNGSFETEATKDEPGDGGAREGDAEGTRAKAPNGPSAVDGPGSGL